MNKAAVYYNIIKLIQNILCLNYIIYKENNMY